MLQSYYFFTNRNFYVTFIKKKLFSASVVFNLINVVYVNVNIVLSINLFSLFLLKLNSYFAISCYNIILPVSTYLLGRKENSTNYSYEQVR